MSDKPLHWQDNLVYKTVDQINKDLYDFGATVAEIPSVPEAYTHLVKQLSDILKTLSPQKIQVLMYKIDIPEVAFRALNRQKLSKADFLNQLSKMMIEREFKKVYLRHYFKTKNPRLEQ